MVVATIGMCRWLKYAVRVGAAVLALSTAVLLGCFFLANDELNTTVRLLYQSLGDGSMVVKVVSGILTILGLLPDTISEADKHSRTLFAVSWLGNQASAGSNACGDISRELHRDAGGRFRVPLVVVRRRLAQDAPAVDDPTLRLGIFGFSS